MACAVGIATSRVWEQWRPGRFGELLLVAACTAALAWPLRRGTRCSWATALACVQVAVLVVFAGVLPAAACAVFALAAIAVGGALAGRVPVALQCACGLAIAGGALGWLLPLPIHTRWVYLAACVAAVAWRRRALASALRVAAAEWSRAVATSPRAAAWAVLVLGLAATACWLPTLQVDDLGYHLRLPWELQLHGRYAPDPWRHVWAVAPWASDVQHGIVQVLAGRESRGALNALWIAVTAAGVWRIATTLGASARAGWCAVALYASLPLTASLAAGMQTENAAVALIAWLAWLVLAPADGGMARKLPAAATLVGGLWGLKLMAAAQATLLVAWASWRHRRSLPWRWLAPCALLVCAVGGSSYVYGAVVAGNPFLPLFNATFASPYFATTDFDDGRWHAGWTPLLPWTLTFATARYHEGFIGAAGFALVALAGAWCLAIADRRTRELALVGALMLALTLAPLQYLRYAFPAMVLLVACVAPVADRFGRSGMRLLIVVCLLNLAFQSNAHWMLRTGALKQSVLALGADRPLFEQYAPERALLADLRREGRGAVLAVDGERPWVAEAGRSGRMLAWYDPTLQRAARTADTDASGTAWSRILRAHRITDLLLRDDSNSTALRTALAQLRARRVASVAGVSRWRIDGATSQ